MTTIVVEWIGIYEWGSEKRTKEIVLQGICNEDPDNMDPNVGKYVTFCSTSMEGLALMHRIQQGSEHGFIAVIEDAEKEMKIAPGYKLVVVSGNGPNVEEENAFESLGTRFTLFQGEEPIARCHLSYRDGSWDPSFAPTVEMIAVKLSHRGKGFLKVLWYWVRCFIEESFTIECLNNDAPHKHIMVKASQLTNAEIDVTDSGVSISDKDWFYMFCCFSVREQKGIMYAMMGQKRALDEEAVIYIPLLTRAAIQRRSKRKDPNAPEIGDATLVESRGARECYHCQKIQTNLSMCSKCSDAY